MKFLLFLFLLVPELIFLFLSLSQNGLFMMLSTPSALISIASEGSLFSVLLLVAFTLACLEAALWSARHVSLFPQIVAAFALSLVASVVLLFSGTNGLSQIFLSLLINPVVLMSLFFPAVCVGTVVCMLVLQPLARMTRRRSKLRVVLHGQGGVLLTMFACLFVTAFLYTLCDALGFLKTPVLSGPLAGYLENLRLVPGFGETRLWMHRVPLWIRFLVLTPCALTACLWLAGSLRKGSRRAHAASAPPVRRAAAVPTARRHTVSAAASRPAAAGREQAMLDAMERTVRSGGVAGLNTRTGRATF